MMNILPEKYFKTVLSGEVLHGSLLQWLLEHGDFSNMDISQGSVATQLRCGGIFKQDFVASLSLSLSAKEFWKSANIWGNYVHEFSVLFFFDLRCITGIWHFPLISCCLALKM